MYVKIIALLGREKVSLMCSHTIYKNKFQIDQGFKVKHKSTKRNIQDNIFITLEKEKPFLAYDQTRQQKGYIFGQIKIPKGQSYK